MYTYNLLQPNPIRSSLLNSKFIVKTSPGINHLGLEEEIGVIKDFI